MIIGNGDIASILKDREGFVFFASGVSNSQETRASEFRREKDLLFDQIDLCFQKNLRLVYFSSLAVYNSDTPYFKHKRKMEQYVKMFPEWTIVRIGNISWGTNPHTLINYMKGQVARGEEIVVQDVYRHLIDKDEFLYWLEMIPNWNTEMNVPGRRLKVKEIVEQYVHA